MPEQVNIASLTINVDDVIKESARLKKSIDDLKNTQKGLDTSTKQGAEAFARNEVQLKQLSKAYRDNQNFATALDSANKDLTKTMQVEGKSTQQLRDSRSQLNQISKNIIGNTDEEIKLREQLNKAIDDQTEALRGQSSEFNRDKDRVGEYKKSIIEAVNELRKQQEFLEESKKELIANQKELKKGTEEYENYSLALISVDNDLKKVNDELEQTNESFDLSNLSIKGFVENSKDAGGATNLIKGGLKAATQSMKSFTKATLAFLFTPVGVVLAAIAGAFLLIKNAMNRSEEATAKLKSGFAAFSGVAKALLKFLQPLGEFLIDGLVKGFELVEKGLFSALSAIEKGLRFLGLDTAADNLKGFTDQVEESVKASKELVAAELELTKAQREARKTQLEYQKEAEKLRQIRDDESKSIPERIKANEQLGRVLNKQLSDELNLAQKALDYANLRIKLEGETKDALDARAEAETEIVDIQERIIGQQSEQLVNINSLKREQAQLTKEKEEAAKKEFETAVEYAKKQQEEIIKLREQQQEYDLAQEEKDKERRLINAENRAIAAELASNNEFAIRQAQLDAQKEAEIKAAKDTGASVGLIKKKYAAYDKQLEAEVTRFKQEQRADILSGLTQLFGESSKLGKAFAVAEIANNTALNASKAFGQAAVFASNPLTLPLALNANIQGGLIVALGAAQIAKTAGLKLAGGGMVYGKGSAKSDSIPAMLSNGESVINANSTRLFAPLLSEINAMGGGDRFANGGIAGGASINTTLIDYDLLAFKVSEANKSLPAPQVAVTEIREVANNLEVVENLAGE